MFEKIISVIRSVALVGAMLFVLWIVGFGADVKDTVVLLLFLVTILFAVLEILGIIYHQIRAGRAKTAEQQEFIMAFFLNNHYEISVTAYLRRISLLGFVSLLICISALNVDSDFITAFRFTGGNFEQYFLAFLKWSVVALPIMIVLTILKAWYILPHLGTGAYSIPTILLKTIGSDFIFFFNDISRAFSKPKKIFPIIRVMLELAFLAFTVMGIISTAG